MCDFQLFGDLISRVRAGDQDAAAELVRRFEPLVRREVRLHLEDYRLRRVFDSMDVTQSVFASFFIRSAAGEYDLNNPQQLAGLLVQMARNKVASSIRMHSRHRRDVRRADANEEALHHAQSNAPAPLEALEQEELLTMLQQGLSTEEREIADHRAHGRTWEEIALRMGGSPQARRMHLVRGVARIAKLAGWTSCL